MIIAWTPLQLKQLSLLVKQGLTATQIGREIGKSRNAIISKISRSGMQLKNSRGGARPQQQTPRKTRSVVRIIGNRPELVNEYKQEVRQAATEPLHLRFDQLEFGMCRYPYGDSPFTFCCQEIMTGSSYCPAHHKPCNTQPMGGDRSSAELRKRMYARRHVRAA